MGVLLFVSVLTPLLLGAAMALQPLRPWMVRLAPWAALPALAAALLLPVDTAFHAPWLFLGGDFVLDTLAKTFLAFSAAVWLAAGVYARGYLEINQEPKKASFFAFFLGTMGGNLALIPTQDMVTYIAFFALMGFAAYGLIVHHRTTDNLFAGRVYIAMTIMGEVAAFGGMVWAASLAGGQTSFEGAIAAIATRPERGFIFGLMFIGFGIKLGVMPLHVWLPLAHPAAPTPASAVLSGVMIKTGLLLWMRLFPFDASYMFDGGVLIAAGLVTAFTAAVIGMTQTHPKSLLAYSSVSQMGLAAIAVGAGLVMGAGREAILAVVLLFAAHHAIVKSALFLGVGIAASNLTPGMRRALMAGLALAGVSLAGFPFTSGMAGKAGIKGIAALTETGWTPLLYWLLPLTGVTTMLLLFRFLVIIAPAPAEPHGRANRHMMFPWALLTLAVPLLPLVAIAMGWFLPRELSLYPRGILNAAWPPLVGIGIGIAVWKTEAIRTPLAAVRIPAGDILFPVIRGWRHTKRLLHVTVLTPALSAQPVPGKIYTVLTEYRGKVLQTAARYETFALGMLLMTAIAIGMALIL